MTVVAKAPVRADERVGSVLDLIGNTPLVRLRSIEKKAGGGVEIWAKCEFCNPGGSVKDRAASQMVKDALADGRVAPGRTLIDSTSGNTGVAYSMIGAALGFPVTLVMPANVSIARKQIISAYGTKIIYSSELEGSDGAINLVREIVEKDPDRYFYPDQYSNDSNPRAHYLGTGSEILREVGEKLTHFVAGIGTTGTVMGTGRRLKDHDARIQVVAVEPDDALHGLEGLKHLPTSLVPGIWKPEGIVDRMLPIPTDEAWDISDALKVDEGLFVGHSAGGAVAGALRVAREAGPGACVVTILPDRGERYFGPLKWEKQYVW
jgi:cysteine synthase B